MVLSEEIDPAGVVEGVDIWPTGFDSFEDTRRDVFGVTRPIAPCMVLTVEKENGLQARGVLRKPSLSINLEVIFSAVVTQYIVVKRTDRR